VKFFTYVHATKLKANINDGFATTSQNHKNFNYIRIHQSAVQGRHLLVGG